MWSCASRNCGRVVLPGAAGAAPPPYRALPAVVVEAYVHSTSTGKVDDLVEALGVDTGIPKLEVSGSAEFDTEVASVPVMRCPSGRGRDLPGDLLVGRVAYSCRGGVLL